MTPQELVDKFNKQYPFNHETQKGSTIMYRTVAADGVPYLAEETRTPAFVSRNGYPSVFLRNRTGWYLIEEQHVDYSYNHQPIAAQPLRNGAQ